MTTIAVSDESRRQFTLLMSIHAIEKNRNLNQPEFFDMLLDNWKETHKEEVSP